MGQVTRCRIHQKVAPVIPAARPTKMTSSTACRCQNELDGITWVRLRIPNWRAQVPSALSTSGVALVM